jgi:hypothetical protein
MATAKSLKGSARRLFMARTVQELGTGGQRRAERELGWNRETIRKGVQELTTGIVDEEALHRRGRKPVEARLPNLLQDIKYLVDGQSQTDPQFRNQRLYTRLTPGEVRRQLIAQKGYSDKALPCEEVIRQRLNRLGYYPKTVQKSQPKKRLQRPTPSSIG